MQSQFDVDAVATLLEKGTADDDFSGVVLIRRGDETLHAGAIGLANRTWQVPNTLDTRFRVASISKMFTAVAVLQLVEQDRVRLDGRIVELLALRDTTIPPSVTVEQLLAMTGGIADWFDETGDWAANWDALLRAQPIYLLRSNADYLPLFARKPPRFAPGERHEYNGASYILLGMLIEQVADMPFFDYVRRHVFAPANMRDSDFVALEGVQPRVAEGYVPVHDAADTAIGWKKNIYSTTPEAAADGGATSTAADLIAFVQALRSGRLLDPTMTREMLAPRVSERDEKVRGFTWKYGYGVMSILDDAGNVVRWGHTGEEDGVSARLYHYPVLDLDVAILGNTSWSAGKLAWNIHDLLMG